MDGFQPFDAETEAEFARLLDLGPPPVTALMVCNRILPRAYQNAINNAALLSEYREEDAEAARKYAGYDQGAIARTDRMRGFA